MNDLPIQSLAQGPGSSVLVFRDRAALRAMLERYNRGQVPGVTTKSLIRAEEIHVGEHTLYLRTRRQMTISGRNRKVDSASRALLMDGVDDDAALRRGLKESGLPYAKLELI